MSAGNLHMDWARVFLDALTAAGVEEFVVCPGSRSTPFVLAAAELARDGRARLHTVIDERSAAFFALGQTKVTGRPGVLVTTSGTAGAHAYPAVIEAGLSHVPFIVLTADRPPELQDAGAPQTVDQARLFGSHARMHVELGLPDDDPRAWDGLRRRAAQAVLATRHPRPGAVHVNAWFRKPLEPQPVTARDLERRAWLRGREELPPVRAWAPRGAPDAAAVTALAEACRHARRGLIVCGPAPIAQSRARHAVEALARATGYPLLAEAASQFRFRAAGTGVADPTEEVARCDAFDLVLRSDAFLERHAPELIIQIGAAPTGDGWRRLLAAHPRAERWVLGPHGWNDPENRAGRLMGDVEETARALVSRVVEAGSAAAGGDGAPGWASAFVRADAAAWRVVDAALAREREHVLPGHAIRALASSLPAGSILALGNSLPIREVDTFLPGNAAAVDVWCQRGANGIDGLVSGAAGAASVAGRPVALILGDVSLLHDLHGLALGRERAERESWRVAPAPLVVMVLHNDGGRIFQELPVAREGGDADVRDAVERHLVVPHGTDFEHAARLFGWRFRRAGKAADLPEALAGAYHDATATLVEVRTPARAGAEARRRIREETARWLEEAAKHPERTPS